MKTDKQRWSELKTKKIIEFVKIHRYENCDEFSTSLMDEVIKRLEEFEKYEGLKNNSRFQEVLSQYFVASLKK